MNLKYIQSNDDENNAIEEANDSDLGGGEPSVSEGGHLAWMTIYYSLLKGCKTDCSQQFAKVHRTYGKQNQIVNWKEITFFNY